MGKLNIVHDLQGWIELKSEDNFEFKFDGNNFSNDVKNFRLTGKKADNKYYSRLKLRNYL